MSNHNREPFLRAIAINAAGSLVAAFVILLVVAFVGATDHTSPRFRFYLIAGTADTAIFVGAIVLFLKVCDAFEPDDNHRQPAKFFLWIIYVAVFGAVGAGLFVALVWLIPDLNSLIARWTGYGTQNGLPVVQVQSAPNSPNSTVTVTVQPTSEPS